MHLQAQLEKHEAFFLQGETSPPASRIHHLVVIQGSKPRICAEREQPYLLTGIFQNVQVFFICEDLNLLLW